MPGRADRPIDAAELLRAADPEAAARLLLGADLGVGEVRVRLVEVESYGGGDDGPWPDPAAHSHRGRTPRNAVMFTGGGHLYLYRIYGTHLCANITYGPDGVAGGVLLRAGEVVAGEEPARLRRPAARSAAALARGPANLAAALGLTIDDLGADVTTTQGRVRLTLPERPCSGAVRSGPRVGVSRAADRPWRFWLAGSPAVSAYRRHLTASGW